ncbi:HypC/HybG/HupF family hydrogenase formation chaperone [Patescibacteria group bacterium]|nr:HypC/HybG/HupF family hydrogenase formation chaperone [Patescibacteria group bacterium]MBU2219620.1 HypC/HybG/HupF family hydrogenase formation chaperone [Patescibacteria group bacterium]MBU2265252.1 HypC/HybG/HupF family hydrogenase formation chaperone [Patescibacteria group bacterium]
MCLTLPKQVVAINKTAIKVKVNNSAELVGSLLPVKRGDWVLTQNRIIIKKITARQAKEINKIILAS